MTREIKFRAWDKDEKKLYAVRDVDFDTHTVTIAGVTSNLGFYLTYPDRCILMQYTGLKDKNGKEIYEGDVVTARNVSGIAVVKWEDGGFVAPMSIFINKEMEIIGNIYENPNLLV